LYSHHGFAVDGYALAYAALQDAGVASASIEEIFAPEVPVVLPAFQPNPLVHDEARPAIGHIDVAFDITKYGRGRAVEIRDAANATSAAKDDLVRLIMTHRFRPRLVNGEFPDTAPVALRYYLHD
jgi:hypothetical protein